MDDYNLLVRGAPTSDIVRALAESLGSPDHINGRIAFQVVGQTAILFEDADYEDDVVGPLGTYPISIAIVTGTNAEMEASILHAQKALAGFETLALRNLSTKLPTKATAAA